MSIVYRWETPDRVLFVDVGAKMSLADIRDMDQTLINYLDTADKPLHIIFDNTDLAMFPTDIRVIATVIHFPKHPNMGWRVIYGESRIVRYLGVLSAKITGTSRLKYVDTLVAAHTFLTGVDNTLTIPKAAD